MNKIVNDVEYYTFSITIPIYKIKPPRNFQKYYQTHKDEIIVDLQKKNKTLKQELQRKDNIINELKDYLEANIEVCDNRLSTPFCNFEKATKERLIFSNCLDKIKELENDD